MFVSGYVVFYKLDVLWSMGCFEQATLEGPETNQHDEQRSMRLLAFFWSITRPCGHFYLSLKSLLWIWYTSKRIACFIIYIPSPVEIYSAADPVSLWSNPHTEPSKRVYERRQSPYLYIVNYCFPLSVPMESVIGGDSKVLVITMSFFLEHARLLNVIILRRKGGKFLTREHLTTSLMSYKHTRLTRNPHDHDPDPNLEWNHLWWPPPTWEMNPWTLWCSCNGM
jgi:hypothetical protein